MLVGLLLRVAGVAPDLIAREYALSAPGRASTMLTTLDHLEHRYGGASPYLLTTGVTRHQLAVARGRLLD